MTVGMKRDKHQIDLARLLGDPAEVARELELFAQDAALFSSDRDHLVETYAMRWVALYDGSVRADAPTLPRLLARVDALGIPRERAVVRFIDKNEPTMIL